MNGTDRILILQVFVVCAPHRPTIHLQAYFPTPAGAD